MKKIVILSRTAWDGALNAWQEFMNVEIDVSEPPRPDMEWHVCGEKINPESNFVDAVPVVRCKDCRFLGDENLGLHDCDHHRGPMRVELDDFCSYGERKEIN